MATYYSTIESANDLLIGSSYDWRYNDWMSSGANYPRTIDDNHLFINGLYYNNCLALFDTLRDGSSLKWAINASVSS